MDRQGGPRPVQGADQAGALTGAPAQPRVGVRALLAGAAVAAAAFAPGLANAQMASAALGGGEKPFTLGLQETTSYDTNPARGNSANATSRGLENDDIDVSPSLTASYSHSIGPYGVALNGNFGYDYHPRNDLLSSERIGFSIIGNAAVGAFCSAGGNARYDRGQSDLQSLTVGVTQNVSQTYTLSGSESCHTATGLTESVQVSFGSTDNSNSLLTNFDSTSVTGMLGYSNAELGTLGVTVGYNISDYTRSGPLVPKPPELQGTSIGLQFSRPIGSRLSGSASVSYSRSTQAALPGVPGAQSNSFSGLTSAIGLTYIATPRMTLTTHVSRSLSGSLLEGVGYTVVTQVDGQASYTISSRISASFGGSWAHTAYEGRQPLLAPGLNLTTPGWQDSTAIFGSVSMQIGRRSSVALNVRHTIGDSDLSLYHFTSEYVGLTLATTF